MIDATLDIVMALFMALWLFERYENIIIPYVVAVPVSAIFTFGMVTLNAGYLEMFWWLVLGVLLFISLIAVTVAHTIYGILKVIRSHKKED